MLLQNNYRSVFPNLLYGEEARFEASTYLDTRGDKHRTVRGAWQPFFFSGRWGPGSGVCALHVRHRTLWVQSLLLTVAGGVHLPGHSL